MSPVHRHGPSAKYKLYGVIYHHGVTATGGHYTLDVLHPNASSVAAGPVGINTPRPGSEGWVRFDDESVRRLKVEEVFGKSPIEDRVAYLLFYRRVQGTQ
jgi:ubiquitin carboxyl-terminal hydrolase 10